MDSTLLIVAGILTVLMLAALALSGRSILASLTVFFFSLGSATFCAFGFMACFEPSNSPVWPWQLAYAVVGTGFLIAAIRGLTNAGRRLRQARGTR